MTENPTRPENTKMDTPGSNAPGDGGGNRRKEMTQEAVATAKANRLEAELGFKPAADDSKPKPADNKKADPGPMTRGLERKLPEL